MRTAILLALVITCAHKARASEVFVCVCDSAIYIIEDSRPRTTHALPKGSLVIGSDLRTIHGTIFRNSVTVSNSEFGWVPREHLARLSDLARTQMQQREGAKIDPSMPIAIRRHQNGSLIKAYNDVSALVATNERLPEAQRVPEPYFARAAIFSIVKDYPKATTDYLRGLRYASRSRRSLDSYERYLPGFGETVKQFTNVPAAPAGATTSDFLAGNMHYALGITEFRQSRYLKAIRSFDNSISVHPHDPGAWYYRSIAHRRVGNTEQALFDVIYGTFLERKRASYPRGMASRLTHIQGPDRTWLEKHRLGDPSHYLLSE